MSTYLFIEIDSNWEEILHYGNSVDTNVTFNGSYVKGLVFPPISSTKLSDQV